MGAAVGKQFQNKPAEQKAKRSSVIITALQLYQKDYPKQPIGVENGQYDSALFKRAVFMAFDSGRCVLTISQLIFCARNFISTNLQHLIQDRRCVWRYVR
jgi:hypothetical protein